MSELETDSISTTVELEVVGTKYLNFVKLQPQSAAMNLWQLVVNELAYQLEMFSTTCNSLLENLEDHSAHAMEFCRTSARNMLQWQKLTLTLTLTLSLLSQLH